MGRTWIDPDNDGAAPVDDEPSWKRQLLVGLGALLAIAVLVGGILGVIALRAADYVGIGDTSSTSRPGPIFPTTDDPSSIATTTPPSTQPPTSKPPPQHLIDLAASPKSVGSFERINLTGSYPSGDGASLQVQRSVGAGAWSDFPTHTTVRNGAFATYVQTAMTGLNHFRMLDAATGKTSNTVTVTIG